MLCHSGTNINVENGSRAIFCTCISITFDAMLNSDVDTSANVTCEEWHEPSAPAQKYTTCGDQLQQICGPPFLNTQNTTCNN